MAYRISITKQRMLMLAIVSVAIVIALIPTFPSTAATNVDYAREAVAAEGITIPYVFVPSPGHIENARQTAESEISHLEAVAPSSSRSKDRAAKANEASVQLATSGSETDPWFKLGWARRANVTAQIGASLPEADSWESSLAGLNEQRGSLLAEIEEAREQLAYTHHSFPEALTNYYRIERSLRSAESLASQMPEIEARRAGQTGYELTARSFFAAQGELADAERLVSSLGVGETSYLSEILAFYEEFKLKAESMLSGAPAPDESYAGSLRAEAARFLDLAAEHLSNGYPASAAHHALHAATIAKVANHVENLTGLRSGEVVNASNLPIAKQNAVDVIGAIAKSDPSHLILWRLGIADTPIQTADLVLSRELDATESVSDSTVKVAYAEYIRAAEYAEASRELLAAH